MTFLTSFTVTKCRDHDLYEFQTSYFCFLLWFQWVYTSGYLPCLNWFWEISMRVNGAVRNDLLKYWFLYNLQLVCSHVPLRHCLFRTGSSRFAFRIRAVELNMNRSCIHIWYGNYLKNVDEIKYLWWRQWHDFKRITESMIRVEYAIL